MVSIFAAGTAKARITRCMGVYAKRGLNVDRKWSGTS
jgi:hypothetical protein